MTTSVEHMMRRFLGASQQSLAAATDRRKPETEFQWACSHATLAAMCAYLLEALHSNDQGEADEVAWQLDRFAEDGEPLADWVAQRSQAWGVPPVGAAQLDRRMNIQEAATMLGCPYYRGEGHCRSGCSQERRCITDSPYPDGWEGVLVQAEREEPGSVSAALSRTDRKD